MTAVGFLGM